MWVNLGYFTTAVSFEATQHCWNSSTTQVHGTNGSIQIETQVQLKDMISGTVCTVCDWKHANLNVNV